ncbi:MAG: flagellar biosynthetic protein FliO [Candidatus Eremiobacteraeota bacterium]|nr:flagellar biosynthetic protein FliO [Candidatus Eremiobacteraeota bacterium]
MAAPFAAHYLLGLLTVAVLLCVLWFVPRAVRWRSFVPGNDRRLIRVVQSTLLSPDATLHVVKIAERYYALGGGHGHLFMLCEVPADTVRTCALPSELSGLKDF